MDRGTLWRVWLPMVAGLWRLGVIFRSGPGPHGLARWIGLLLGLIGLAGVILSRYTLGRSFSIAPKATAWSPAASIRGSAIRFTFPE